MSHFFQKKKKTNNKSPFLRLHSLEDIFVKVETLSLPTEINMTYHYNLTTYCKTLIHYPDSSPPRGVTSRGEVYFQLLHQKFVCNFRGGSGGGARGPGPPPDHQK